MPDIVERIRHEWPVIKAAPFSFCMALAAIAIPLGIAIWLAVNWHFQGIIDLQDRQLADFREKSKSATPQAVADKIATLEHTLTELAKNTGVQKPILEDVNDQIMDNKDGTFLVKKTVAVKSIYVPPVLIIEVYAKEIVRWNVESLDTNHMSIWFDVDKPTVKSAAVSSPYGRYVISITTKQDSVVRYNLRFN